MKFKSDFAEEAGEWEALAIESGLGLESVSAALLFSLLERRYAELNTDPGGTAEEWDEFEAQVLSFFVHLMRGVIPEARKGEWLFA